MLIFASESLIVIQSDFHEVAIPLHVPASRSSVIILASHIPWVIPCTIIVHETALVKAYLGIEAVHDVVLDVTLAIEVRHAVFPVILILVLHRVTLVVIVIRSGEIRTVLIEDRENR